MIRSTMARAIPMPSDRRAHDLTVPRTSQRDYFCWPTSRCGDCALAVLGSGDGHPPPRSFLRDKPSWRCAWSQSHRCGDTHRLDGSAECQNCRRAVLRGNRNRPEIERESPWASAVVSSWYLSEIEASAVAEPAPAPHRSPLPAVTALARAPICWMWIGKHY